MSFKFKGLRDIESKFSKKVKEIERYTEQGLQEAAEHLLNKSLPLVPVDTGRLRRSGIVTSDGPEKRYVSFEAHDPKSGYEYAPIQHEHLGFKHTVGQAKFLEQPFIEEFDVMLKIIADSAKKGTE